MSSSQFILYRVCSGCLSECESFRREVRLSKYYWERPFVGRTMTAIACAQGISNALSKNRGICKSYHEWYILGNVQYATHSTSLDIVNIVNCANIILPFPLFVEYTPAPALWMRHKQRQHRRRHRMPINRNRLSCAAIVSAVVRSFRFLRLARESTCDSQQLNSKFVKTTSESLPSNCNKDRYFLFVSHACVNVLVRFERGNAGRERESVCVF